MLETQNSPLTAEQINLPQTGKIEITNENPGQNSPDNQNSTLEKLRSAVSGVVEKWKPGRGRPRKDGQPKKSDIPVESSAQNIPVAPAPAPALASTPVYSPAAEIFRKSVVSAVKGVFGIFKDLVKIKARAAGIDEVFTAKTLKEAAPDDEKLNNFCESLDAVLKKHNAQPKNAEEISLVINGVSLISPMVLLLSTFNQEIERKRALEAKQ